MILGEILPSCLARNWAGIFYDMYNLAGCTVVSRNLRSCKPTSDERFGTMLYIVQNSLLSPLFRFLVLEISSSSNAHMRHTRRHVSFGDAATWGDLPAGCRRLRAWSFHSNAVIRLRGSGNTGRHICDRVYRSAAQVVTRLDPAVLLRD